jgi:hypothetical protein
MINNVFWTSGHSEQFLTLAKITWDHSTPLLFRIDTASRSENNFTGTRAVGARRETWCVAPDNLGMAAWVVDQEGNVRVGLAVDGAGIRAIHRRNDDDAWVPLHNLGLGEFPIAIDWDGRTAYEPRLGNTGTWGVAKYDLLSQTKGAMVASDGDCDIVNPRELWGNGEHLLFSAGKRRLIGVRYKEGAKTIWLDPDMARAQATFDHYFPGSVNLISSWSDDCTKVVVEVWSGDASPKYLLLDTKARKLRRLFN